MQFTIFIVIIIIIYKAISAKSIKPYKYVKVKAIMSIDVYYCTAETLKHYLTYNPANNLIIDALYKTPPTISKVAQNWIRHPLKLMVIEHDR